MIRELLLSGAALAAIYAILIAFLYQDLTVPVKSYITAAARIILMAAIGIAAHYFFIDTAVLDSILPIKSTMARLVIPGAALPLVEASFRLCFIPACFLAIIDKLIYFWCHKRLPYLITLLATATLTSIGYFTLLAIAGEPSRTIVEMTTFFNEAFEMIVPIQIAFIGLLFILIVISIITHQKHSNASH